MTYDPPYSIHANNIKYSRIHSRVEYSLRLHARTPSTNTQTQRRRVGRKKRTNVFLLVISLIYFFSWLPISILVVTKKFGLVPMSDPDGVVVYGLCHIFAMSRTCTNPILYAFLNKDFNKVNISVIQCP